LIDYSRISVPGVDATGPTGRERKGRLVERHHVAQREDPGRRRATGVAGRALEKCEIHGRDREEFRGAGEGRSLVHLERRRAEKVSQYRQSRVLQVTIPVSASSW